MGHSDRRLVPAGHAEYDGDMLAFACCIPPLAHLSPLVCFAHNLSGAAAASPSPLCLQPRDLITTATPSCSASAACASSSATCVSPQLAGGQTLLLLLVEAPDGGGRDEVRFVGRVEEVLGAVEGTNYAVRGWLRFALLFAPLLWSLAVRWPALCTRALQFIVAVSASLLVLNALPIPYADGEQFVHALAAVARDKRRPTGWYDRTLQRVLRVLPMWWWHERQVQLRVRLVTALFLVNVAFSLLPIVTIIATFGLSDR